MQGKQKSPTGGIVFAVGDVWMEGLCVLFAVCLRGERGAYFWRIKIFIGVPEKFHFSRILFSRKRL